MRYVESTRVQSRSWENRGRAKWFEAGLRGERVAVGTAQSPTEIGPVDGLIIAGHEAKKAGSVCAATAEVPTCRGTAFQAGLTRPRPCIPPQEAYTSRRLHSGGPARSPVNCHHDCHHGMSTIAKSGRRFHRVARVMPRTKIDESGGATPGFAHTTQGPTGGYVAVSSPLPRVRLGDADRRYATPDSAWERRACAHASSSPGRRDSDANSIRGPLTEVKNRMCGASSDE
jgi:hypothetical protein